MKTKALLFFGVFAVCASAFAGVASAQVTGDPACLTGPIQTQISCLQTLIPQLQQQLLALQNQLSTLFHDGSHIKTVVGSLRIRSAPSVTASVASTTHPTAPFGSKGVITCVSGFGCPAT